MRELAEATGLPRTTIHHYLREGLLPPPTRTAANAALYGPEHVRRLLLLKALRGPGLGPLSLEEIREVLPAVESGVPPATAVEIAALRRRAVGLAATTSESPEPVLTLREIARRTGREPRELRELVEDGVLRPGAGADRFDRADLAAAAGCARLLEAGLTPDDLQPIAALLGEVSSYESALLDVVARGAPEPEREGRVESLRRALRDLHAYLLVRAEVE